METKPTFHWGAFLLLATISFVAAEEKKNLKLVLDSLEKVKDAEHILKTDITFDKVNDNEVKINGQIEQAVDLDEDYKVNMDIYHTTEQDGEYKKIIGLPNTGVCTVMANQYKHYLYDSLKEHANAPDPDKCPVTQETYIIKDYPFDSTTFQKYLRPGFYKIVTSLIHADEEVLQYTVLGHTENE